MRRVAQQASVLLPAEGCVADAGIGADADDEPDVLAGFRLDGLRDVDVGREVDVGGLLGFWKENE